MKQRLLIADRDAELCELYRMFLTERGYEVETSTDGLDCLAKLRHVTPAVLVLDLELLWGGGDGVLAWLREESRAPGFPCCSRPPLPIGRIWPNSTSRPSWTTCPNPSRWPDLLESIRSAVAKKGRREPSNLDRVPGYPGLLVE